MVLHATRYMPVIEGRNLTDHMEAAVISQRRLAELLSADLKYEIGYWTIRKWCQPGMHVIESDELYALQRVFIGLLE